MHPPGQSVSHYFGKPGTSAYAFRLTWTPGTVTLAGDIGEISIVHYHALRSYKDGMYWLRNSGYDYLMEKASPREQVVDHDATYDFIIEQANQQLGELFKARREAHAQWLRETQWAREEYARACETQLANLELDPEDITQLEDLMPEPFKAEFPEIKRVDFKDRSMYGDKRFRDWIVPDGCELWFRLQQELADYYNPNDIFKASVRERIREELKSHLHDRDSSQVAEFCYDLGLDDYYGSRKYKEHSIYQIEALQFAARRICAEFERVDDLWHNRLRRWLTNKWQAVQLVAPRLWFLG